MAQLQSNSLPPFDTPFSKIAPRVLTPTNSEGFHRMLDQKSTKFGRFLPPSLSEIGRLPLAFVRPDGTPQLGTRVTAQPLL